MGSNLAIGETVAWEGVVPGDICTAVRLGRVVDIRGRCVVVQVAGTGRIKTIHADQILVEEQG